jgi:hypothetical protein
MEYRNSAESTSVEVTFWLESDGSICLTGPGFDQAPMRIKNDPERPSGHPRLFRYLTECLRHRGTPAPADL